MKNVLSTALDFSLRVAVLLVMAAITFLLVRYGDYRAYRKQAEARIQALEKKIEDIQREKQEETVLWNSTDVPLPAPSGKTEE